MSRTTSPSCTSRRARRSRCMSRSSPTWRPDRPSAGRLDSLQGYKGQDMIASFDTLVLGAVLLIATLTDLRTRQVPGWLTFGGISSGVAVAAMNGVDALFASLLGTIV